MLTVVLIMVIVFATVAGVWLTGWMTSLRRARSAADLAALAGAQVVAGGGDACVAARSNARKNKAEVIVCSVDDQGEEFTVRVTARVELRPSVVGAPKWAEVEAKAGRVS